MEKEPRDIIDRWLRRFVPDIDDAAKTSMVEDVAWTPGDVLINELRKAGFEIVKKP